MKISTFCCCCLVSKNKLLCNPRTRKKKWNLSEDSLSILSFKKDVASKTIAAIPYLFSASMTK